MKIETSSSVAGQDWVGALPSWFSEAGRMPISELMKYSRKAIADPMVKAVLESAPGFVMILNRQHQILAVNDNLLAALGFHVMENVLGLRIGECLGCENVSLGPDGCGTSSLCSHCGAAIAIMVAQAEDLPFARESSIKVRRDGVFDCLEFKVKVTPLNLGRLPVLVFVFHDISAMKRKKVLERVFLNDMGDLMESLDLREGKLRPDDEGFIQRSTRFIKAEDREIGKYLSILKAENGTLTVEYTEVNVGSLMDELAATFEDDERTRGKTLFFHPEGRAAFVRTDRNLLKRILVNMIKNGLDAAPESGRVHVEFGVSNMRPKFSVHNYGMIAPEVQALIFHRSFSTKGKEGRGLGTYTMKLIGETYLKGEVGFTSTVKEGTTFYFLLPPA